MAKRIGTMAVFVALAMVFSYIEVLIPFNFGIPGIKLGLPNIIIVMALYAMGTKEAFTINCVRIFLFSLMFSGLFGMLYSLGGGLLSFVVMILLKRSGWFSMTGVSMAGGVFHNLGQLLVASVVIESGKLFYYLPVLLIAGMITGTLTGILAYQILNRVKFLYDRK